MNIINEFIIYRNNVKIARKWLNISQLFTNKVVYSCLQLVNNNVASFFKLVIFFYIGILKFMPIYFWSSSSGVDPFRIFLG